MSRAEEVSPVSSPGLERSQRYYEFPDNAELEAYRREQATKAANNVKLQYERQRKTKADVFKHSSVSYKISGATRRVGRGELCMVSETGKCL